MRIAIVNDSGLAIEALRRVVTRGGHTVAWVARDGSAAVSQAQADRPDLVLMDLRMPVMDGVACTRAIMAAAPCAILVVTATVAGHYGQVYDAMGAGALDAIDTPVLGTGGSVAGDAALLEKIARIGILIGSPSPAPAPAPGPAPVPAATAAVTLVGLGSSTGGPDALANLLGAIPAPARAAIIIVQHVDKDLATGLASWLSQRTGHAARVALTGDTPAAGQVYVAASDDHLVIDRGGYLAYTAHPRKHAYRPSVDVFFHSLVAHWPAPAMAALLTGMGRDGADGLLALRRAGWWTAAQDEASSVVYGMPRAAAEVGAAAHVLPPRSIGERIAHRLGRRG